MSTDFLTSTPKWFLVILAAVGMIVAGAVAHIASAELRDATHDNREQDKIVTAHEQRLDWHDQAHMKHEQAFEKFDDKLDKILERLNAR